jgi:hypothetical protein
MLFTILRIRGDYFNINVFLVRQDLSCCTVYISYEFHALDLPRHFYVRHLQVNFEILESKWKESFVESFTVRRLQEHVAGINKETLERLK